MQKQTRGDEPRRTFTFPMGLQEPAQEPPLHNRRVCPFAPRPRPPCWYRSVRQLRFKISTVKICNTSSILRDNVPHDNIAITPVKAKARNCFVRLVHLRCFSSNYKVVLLNLLQIEYPIYKIEDYKIM